MTKRHNRTAMAVLAAAVVYAPATAARTYELEELRAAARAQHPTLASAQAAVDAATAMERRRRLLDDPVALLESGRADGGAASGTEWRVELAQRVPLPGSRRWRVRAAAAVGEQARHDLRALEDLLDYEVGRLWVGVVLAGRAAEVGGESEAIAGRLLELIERRVEAGEAPPLQAIKARTEWFARRRLSLELGRELATARAALDVVCNRSLGADFVVAGDLDAPRALPLLEVLLAWLDDSSPRLRAARAMIAGFEAERAAERLGALPDVELSIARESELDKEATSGGVALTLPLWNRNRAAVAGAEADLRRSRAELEDLRLELEIELERAVAEYRAAAETLALYPEGWREAAQRTVEISGFSYENGEGSLLDLLDAQRASLEVGLAEAETGARLTLARLRIEQLLGASLEEVDSDDDD